MTVLNIGARLGTATRTITKETGTWVDGIEWDEGLVDDAVRLSAKEGLVKKAVIRNLNLDDPEVREHKRDAIVIREFLYQMPERERLFKTLADLLKPSSHFLVTEFLVNASKGQEEQAEWSALHRTVPRLFELDEIREGLNKVGFDVRVDKDETKSYRAALLNDIRKFGGSVADTPYYGNCRNGPVHLPRWTRAASPCTASTPSRPWQTQRNPNTIPNPNLNYGRQATAIHSISISNGIGHEPTAAKVRAGG